MVATVDSTTSTPDSEVRKKRVFRQKADDAVEIKNDKALKVAYAKKLFKLLEVPRTKVNTVEELERLEKEQWSLDKRGVLWYIIQEMEKRGFVEKVRVDGKKRELVCAVQGITEDDIKFE
jgi:hypothetical protein